MSNVKIKDVSRGATLLKKIIERSDRNLDGAVRGSEVVGIKPKNCPTTGPKWGVAQQAAQGVQKFAQSKGSVTVEDVKKAVDEVAKRVKAADLDGDGFLSDAEAKKLTSLAEKRFANFVANHAGDSIDDFEIPPQKEAKRPSFKWSGTPAEVCTSLLNAYSDPKNDNFWPSWAGKGASRYVVKSAEAKEMVKALEPLYTSRRKAVLTELSNRTLDSHFGCVSCDAGARAVFEKLAKELGVTGLEFKSPVAPKVPAP